MVYKQRNIRANDRKKSLITYFNHDSTVAEQFRSIRANIHILTNVHHIRTLLVTSPSDGEGKSTTIANLAVSLSQQNERVLLIDSNLRRPTVHLTFKIQNEVGLTSVLTGTSSLENAIFKTEIGPLDILPSGPLTPFPSELLASDKLEQLLARTNGYYDYVLVDSPSILELADTKILANQCDGVILVINKGKTGLEKTMEAKKKLEFVNSKIIGVILNEK